MGAADRLLLTGVVIVAEVIGGVLASFALVLHLSFAFSAYDVGMHLQALWKLSRLAGLFNTIRGMNYWGDHLWIGFGLLAPVYRLWSSPAVVYLYQGLGLATGGIAIYGLARQRLRSRLAALVPAVLYWCYPAVIYTAWDDFHPEAIASTWLLGALWAADARRPRVYWTAIVLALLTKEDIALYLLGFAAYDFVRGARRRALTLAALSAGYLLIAMKVLLPLFNGVGFFRASGGYWFSAWAANAARPAYYWDLLTRPELRAYTWDILWPVAFLPILHPLTLVLLAGPAFLVNNLGGGYLLDIHYHYQYGVIPGVFVATIATFATFEARARRWLRQQWIRRTLGALVLGAVLLPTLWPQMADRRSVRAYWFMATHLRPNESPKLELIRELVARTPPDAKVSASHNLVPALANREWIFMFPNPWRVMYWGINGENPTAPELVDTLFLDTDAIGPDLTQLAREIVSSGWLLVAWDQKVLYAVRPKR